MWCNKVPASTSVSLQMNDYVAAYHDAVLLVGQVMRDLGNKSQLEMEQMEFVNVNYFRNISFDGKEAARANCFHGNYQRGILYMLI